MSVILGIIAGLFTSSPISSTLYTIAEYIVLVDGECLNALLPMDSILSTSNHLFWNRILESILVP